MAAAKCLIGREKDRVQLQFLIGAGILEPGLLRGRIAEISLPEDTIASGLRFVDDSNWLTMNAIERLEPNATQACVKRLHPPVIP